MYRLPFWVLILPPDLPDYCTLITHYKYD